MMETFGNIKKIIKKRVNLSFIVNIVICASKLPEAPAKACYSLVGDLHGMQGVSGSSPLGSIKVLTIPISLVNSSDNKR